MKKTEQQESDKNLKKKHQGQPISYFINPLMKSRFFKVFTTRSIKLKHKHTRN